ncbi:MAG: hypothetical protein QXU82_02610 [Candidatus Aenigmatarchaeota archaeon]
MDKPIFDFMKAEKRAGKPKGTGIPLTEASSPYIGLYLATGPTKPPGMETKVNQTTELNMTAAPGVASALYYALVFQLPKWGYNVVKVDEWIEVSPTHTEYYQRTLSQKRELEATIKQGMASTAALVSDYELAKHDLRKYREILDYFEKKDEHSLRAMFIDQVDIHTDVQGQAPVALRSIAPRWPTIVADFMKLSDKDVDPEGISKKLGVSKAEGVVLATKNRLYVEWKKLFGEAAKERYATIKGMVEARKASVEEYREWLKPYITKFKMMKTGHETAFRRGSALSSFADVTGQKTFSNNVRLWAWKAFSAEEVHKPGVEKVGDFIHDPYDSYVRENLILNDKTGLASIYPWLLNRVPEKKFKKGEIECEADLMVEEIKKEWKAGMHSLDPNQLYYIFFDIDVLRVGSVLPLGELEDITFTIRTYMLSQNIMLVKLLELKCRQKELEHYIDEMLGVRIEEKHISEVIKEEFPGMFGEKPKKLTPLGELAKDWAKTVEEFRGMFAPFGKVSLKEEHKRFFVKAGPYEREFKERLSKYYLTQAGEKFGAIVGFIKGRMGVG